MTAARLVAASMCGDLRAGQLLDGTFERRSATLDARDRRWVQELVWGMLRSRSTLDAILAPRVRGGLAVLDDDLTDLLRLGVYQLQAMNSVPAYAAIGETVELAKRRHGIGAGRLVNAVLRRIDREGTRIAPAVPDDPIEALAQTYSHPAWVIARWVERWGLRDTERLLAANNTPAPVIVRPWRIDTDTLAARLHADGVGTTPDALLPDALHLAAGTALTTLATFRDGEFFVQDPAATLVARYAHVPEGSLVADLCAAPGGKALELSRRAGCVVAADRNRARINRLRDGFARLKATQLLALVADARQPPLQPVDAVLVDVPCTGTGTFRRHPDARWRLKVSDFAVLGALQCAILQAAATIVKPGGLLIYSTCSLEPEENDDMVNAFLATHPAFTLEPPPADVVPATVLDEGRLRVLPHRHGSDGAFAMRLRRHA